MNDTDSFQIVKSLLDNQCISVTLLGILVNIQYDQSFSQIKIHYINIRRRSSLQPTKRTDHYQYVDQPSASLTKKYICSNTIHLSTNRGFGKLLARRERDQRNGFLNKPKLVKSSKGYDDKKEVRILGL